MKPQSCPISTCRSCRYYTPEGRRGGQCQQLGAPVCGGWKACSLGFPPFAPSWEYLEKSISIVSHEAALHDIIHEEKRPVRSETVKTAV